MTTTPTPEQIAELAHALADQAEALAAGRSPKQAAAAARIRDNAETLRHWLVTSDLAGHADPIPERADIIDTVAELRPELDDADAGPSTSPFDHDRPNPLHPQDWEYQCVTPDGATVLVSKVGGGTLGRYYSGAWHYSYSRRDYHAEGSDLMTGTPHTHADAASIVADHLAEQD